MCKRNILSFFICVALLVTLVPSCFAHNFGSMKDPRDGQIYKTVKIGEQTWMAENLNFETEILHLWYEREEYFGGGGFYYDEPTSYCYGDLVGNCLKYGRLYSWSVAMNGDGKWIPKNSEKCGNEKTCSPTYPVQGVCPVGWHLPTQEEWNILISTLGGKSTAGKKLKSTTEWLGRGNGSDDYGFSAFPVGVRKAYGLGDHVYYNTEKRLTYFWSSTEDDSINAYGVYLNYSSTKADLVRDYKSIGGSVRCVENESPKSSGSSVAPTSSSTSLAEGQSEILFDSRDRKMYRTAFIGLQTWMAENLNYITPDSYCYGDDGSNCTKFGRLYEKNVADKVCPDGWHLPDENEWNFLISSVGGKDVANKALKATAGWFGDGNGTDKYGFSAVPAGFKYADGTYSSENQNALFWRVNASNGLSLNYYDKLINPEDDYGAVAASIRCVKDAVKDSFVDSRDGKTYKFVKIGTQVWMAENLNYRTGKSSCPADADSNCIKYGRLYSWNDAMGIEDSLKGKNRECAFCKIPILTYPVQGACPIGWHLPTIKEWNTLFDAVGGYRSAGAYLKSKKGTGWGYCSYNDYMERYCRDAGGSDYFGFTALPAGKDKTVFWSSSGNFRMKAMFVNMDTYSDGAGEDFTEKQQKKSVRCVRDSDRRETKENRVATNASPSATLSSIPPSDGSRKTGSRMKKSSGTFVDARDGQIYKTVKIGKQTWMAQNLNYKTAFSFCYDDDPSKCTEYGRLYLWGAAMEACPADWHLPTKAEWRELLLAVGGVDKDQDGFVHAGKVLKSARSWKNGNGEDGNYGTDDFGFSALAAGMSRYYGTPGYGIEMMEKYENMGDQTLFWTSSGNYGGMWAVNLHKINNDRAYITSDSDVWAYSVRCIKGKRMESPPVVSPSSVVKASFKDPRDGQTYKTVKIGKQTWMAQNLNYETEKSSCYKDSSSNCAKYGRLYTWKSAMIACPKGWHLPDTTEWDTLITSVGGNDVANNKLKSTNGWITCKSWPWANGNGTDDYGFSVIPVESNGGKHSNEENSTTFWISSKPYSTSDYAYFMYFKSDYNYGGFRYFDDINYRRSVRCVKD